MPLDALPNEILLQILKDTYPPGTFQAPYGLTDEILALPHTFQTPVSKPSKCAAKKSEYERCRQFFAALKNADMAMQRIAKTNEQFRRLSRDILVLRAASKEVLPLLSHVKLEDLTWEKLVLALSERDIFLACGISWIHGMEKMHKEMNE